MKEWLLGITFTVLILSVISIILPEGKMGRFIKSFFPFILSFAILIPFFSFDIKDLNLDFSFGENINLQEDFLYKINEEKISAQREYCQKILEDAGINDSETDIEYEIDENNKINIVNVKINLKKSVMNRDKEHIDITGIKSKIATYLNINSEVITIEEQ